MVYEPDPRRLYQMLVSSLQLLSLQSDQQQASLAGFVDVPDELALTFDETFVLKDRMRSAGVIDGPVVVVLEELARQLATMSGVKAMWTIEALQSAPEWKTVRIKAREVLKLLGERVKQPDLSWSKYVRGRHDD